MSLLGGLKRHFRFKAAEGLLSKSSLRSLDYACDAALSRPGVPLNVWKEVWRLACDQVAWPMFVSCSWRRGSPTARVRDAGGFTPRFC